MIIIDFDGKSGPFTYDRETHEMVAEASELACFSLETATIPKTITLRSAYTGALKTFNYDGVTKSADDILHWSYTCFDLRGQFGKPCKMMVFND